jgi:hypothetical protein
MSNITVVGQNTLEVLPVLNLLSDYCAYQVVNGRESPFDPDNLNSVSSTIINNVVKSNKVEPLSQFGCAVQDSASSASLFKVELAFDDTNPFSNGLLQDVLHNEGMVVSLMSGEVYSSADTAKQALGEGNKVDKVVDQFKKIKSTGRAHPELDAFLTFRAELGQGPTPDCDLG